MSSQSLTAVQQTVLSVNMCTMRLSSRVLLSSPADTATACWRSLVVRRLPCPSQNSSIVALDKRQLEMRQQRRRAAASTAPRRRPCSTLVSSAQLHPPSSAGNGADPAAANGWLLSQPPSGPLDAILVLGGGLLPGGGLPEWVVRRLEGGLALWHSQQQVRARAAAVARASAPEAAPAAAAVCTPEAQAGRLPPCPIVLLGAGTPHKRPVLNGAGHVLHEATAYASYLMHRGVPADQLLKEVQSYDTVGAMSAALVLQALRLLRAHAHRTCSTCSTSGMPTSFTTAAPVPISQVQVGNGYFSLTIHVLPAAWR